ncbi:sigma-70 family RNA polymerase sigma factor [Comamonas sp. JC664]|uniref:sigma-70 family RNA polymerase sigma factor n=1 Tax=Comamonas sp. JC664 TaxID=2801917 RepID=UPI00174C3CA4|nr:sigma-70 family RNA polymerase sigma factor [Comamonas sp. JC664]MBL0693276.1 sigma-70 family RNA polymerase sigma factor [Comamonas sp. JC664]GHG97771.1 RNA polymerase sigma factor [Comamonas sp. KCTC 72670]
MALGDDRKVILEKYGPYVRSLAATVRKQFNAQLELDELLAYGQIGLLEAAERFDPKVGANFLTFAHYRIKGAIFDGLRKMGVLRGSDARNAYVGERAAAYLGNLSDRESGAGNRGSSFSDDVSDISDAVAGLAMVFATSMEGADSAGYTDESLPVDVRMEQEQLKTRVRAAIEKLPEKERKLLLGYYFQGRTLEEAGAEIGQSKSWASRLHARAIDRLKELLNEEEELPPSPMDTGRVSHGGSDGRSLRGAGRSAEAAGSGRPADEQAGRVEVRRSSR